MSTYWYHGVSLCCSKLNWYNVVSEKSLKLNAAQCFVPSTKYFSLKLIFATASVMPFFSAWLHWCIIAAPAEIVQNYLCSSEWMIGLCANWNHNSNSHWQRTCYAVYNMKTHKFWDNPLKSHSHNDSVLVVNKLKHGSLFSGWQDFNRTNRLSIDIEIAQHSAIHIVLHVGVHLRQQGSHFCVSFMCTSYNCLKHFAFFCSCIIDTSGGAALARMSIRITIVTLPDTKD